MRFNFLASPVELLGDDRGRARALRIERNEIVPREDGGLGVRGTGAIDEIPAQLVFRAIGHAGVPLNDVPFDAQRGLIRNRDGRVVDETGTLRPGEYVTGWIKRGPSGMIGTNKKDSLETVSKLVEDARAGLLPPPVADDVRELLAASAEHHLGWSGWETIDRVETDAGQRQARPRIKLTRWEALRAAGGRRASVPAGSGIRAAGDGRR